MVDFLTPIKRNGVRLERVPEMMLLIVMNCSPELILVM